MRHRVTSHEVTEAAHELLEPREAVEAQRAHSTRLARLLRRVREQYVGQPAGDLQCEAREEDPLQVGCKPDVVLVAEADCAFATVD